jgi:GNAT superfamily N-acetyltransferase
MVTTATRIRRAVPADAPRLAELAVQLGYDVDPGDLPERVSAILADPRADLLVAADAADEAIGWLHVELKPSLLSPIAAQVRGLVVDERHRSAGVGARLLDAAERWAEQRDCREMLVATRVTRERAHGFYRRQGYALLKTSHMFSKPLA